MLVVFQEFMGRTLRIAPSKRFLRPETKAAIESGSESESSSFEKHEETSSTEVLFLEHSEFFT